MGDHHGNERLAQAGGAMEAVVDRVLVDAGSRTRNLGGTAGCKAFGGHVARAVATG